MGCDIHLKLEKREKNNEKGKWESCIFTRYHCWSERNYGMFARLANIRNYYKEGVIQPLPQRGFPKDAAYDTLKAYTLELVPDDVYNAKEDMYEHLNDCRTYGAYCKESEGRHYIDKEYSDFIGESHEGYKLIVHPDYHSPSYCSTEEMRQCVYDRFNNTDSKLDSWDMEWYALVGEMEGIEKFGQYECRAVFWFDN